MVTTNQTKQKTKSISALRPDHIIIEVIKGQMKKMRIKKIKSGSTESFSLMPLKVFIANK